MKRRYLRQWIQTMLMSLSIAIFVFLASINDFELAGLTVIALMLFALIVNIIILS